ncbi:hypothetical protein J7L48_00585 [bacterium]|nr:hypothetical protein [bacterium]
MKILSGRNKTWFLLLIVLLALSCGSAPYYDIETEGIDPEVLPVQTKIDEKETLNIINNKGRFLVLKLAEYTIQARVLHKKKYSSDPPSVLSPIDLALGWGKFLPKKEYDKYYKVTQFGRWYYFKIKSGAPFTEDHFSLHSANNHIIPANKNVKKEILRIKKGEIIKLKGYLVKISGDVNKKGEFFWQSSLSREDTGNHSCEVFYVETIQTGDKLYY